MKQKRIYIAAATVREILSELWRDEVGSANVGELVEALIYEYCCLLDDRCALRNALETLREELRGATLDTWAPPVYTGSHGD